MTSRGLAGFLLLVATGCVARSTNLYPFRPPVDGIAIREVDWTACDARADRIAVQAAQQDPTQAAIDQAGFVGMQQPSVAGAAGAILLSGLLALGSQPMTPEERLNTTYEGEMRTCLRGHGYPVAGDDPKSFTDPRPAK